MSRCATGEMMGGTEWRTSQISQQGVLVMCEVRTGSKSKYLIENKPIIKSMVTSLQQWRVEIHVLCPCRCQDMFKFVMP